MKKSFTLIELLVSIAIIALLVVAAIPSVPIYREKAEVDAAAKEIKDLILKTRSKALAPEPTSFHYIFVLNIDSVKRTYYDPWIVPLHEVCPDLALEGGYCIVKVVSTEAEPAVPKTERIKIEQDKIDIRNLKIINAYPAPEATGGEDAPFFKIHFRAWDGTVGFGGMFWDVNTYSGTPPGDWGKWDDLWEDAPPKYLVPFIQIQVGQTTREIEINKYTGEIYIK